MMLQTKINQFSEMNIFLFFDTTLSCVNFPNFCIPNQIVLIKIKKRNVNAKYAQCSVDFQT